MRGTIKKVLIVSCIFLLHATISFAGETVPFFYNVLPVQENNSIIDTNYQTTIAFNLYENENTIYFNDEIIPVFKNRFEINISNLSGKQTIMFKNDKNEHATFTYYFSDKNGLVAGYEQDNVKNVKTYVKTINDIKIVYTNKDLKAIKTIEKTINNIPNEIKSNVEEIILLPYVTSQKVAGITKYEKIYLYKVSSYSALTIKQIVSHEIAHTWAQKLIQEKTIDYSYTNYAKAVKEDKKSVSTYSKKFIDKGDYSEDFADSVAFYLINEKSFGKKYPNRTNYFETILK